MDKANFTKNKKFLKLLTIFTSFYEAIYRNMISSLLGISLVFIHKDEFNA